ncbi:MAG: Hpt domain-containing protein, partial [Desulfomonilaceae bacterium]
MDDREEEFIKRLKATFKVESDEHIQTISSGLLELDKNPDPQARIRILETIYREAHSLKGAARAVSLLEVEKICQSIENIFSLLKKEELDLSPVILDTLLDSVEAVANLISNDESSPVGDLLQRLSSIGSTVTNRLDDSSFKPNRKETHKSSERTQTPNGSMFADIPGQFSEISTPLKFLPKQDEERSNQGDQAPVSFSDVTHPLDVQIKSVVVEAKKSSEASAKSFDSNQPEVSFSKQRTVESNRSPHAETVRIQTNKLDSLLYQVEEMVALKMASNQRVLDLKSVKMILDSHRKRWTNVYPEIRIMRKNSGLYYQKENLKPNLVKLMEFLESNETILKSIDRKLKYLISTAADDARQSSLMIDDLLKDMKSVLMLPSSTILEMFPRVVRELAVSQGKKVRLSIDGGNIEIDRRILEEMKDPLIHLVRNSIDHGLETPSERTRKGKGQEGA